MNSTSAWFMPMIKPRGKQLLLAAPPPLASAHKQRL
jgi:hypothetical protein